jgi:hypothetical protein
MVERILVLYLPCTPTAALDYGVGEMIFSENEELSFLGSRSLGDKHFLILFEPYLSDFDVNN